MRAVLFAAMLSVAALPVSAASLQERLAPCLACHGEQGTSATVEVPSLGGQPEDYLLVQLFVFREQLRKAAPMNDMAKGLSDDDLRNFSQALAKLPPPVPAADAGDPARIARAKELIAQHRCNFCHTPTFAGRDQLPRLAGQREDYLVKTMREYKSNTRHGYDAAMASVVQPLTDQDFVDLAHYLARVK